MIIFYYERTSRTFQQDIHGFFQALSIDGCIDLPVEIYYRFIIIDRHIRLFLYFCKSALYG